ncbi:hypothetical protein [Paludisphaera borealis]|uniref:Uncharacterized protein n=2 Tax=Paludisphaera borealis TaxID=1387353 RepID=A0A1U7CUT8_9BACT|nr:hypothetical protein [Paludisphaera borealis]APW62692.1 hypothetical protein BSF38_04243 [Paludisphaera borealis]
MFHRPKTVAWQVVGIVMLIPGLLRVPLPQADFHIIRHHHGFGEVCPQHDHLLRWHPQAGETEDVAVLHWHWLLPQALDITPGGSTPALHAHVVDSLQPEWNSDQVVLSEERARVSVPSDLASWLDLALIGAEGIDSPRLEPPNAWAGARGADDDTSGETARSRLVRWNC